MRRRQKGPGRSLGGLDFLIRCSPKIEPAALHRPTIFWRSTVGNQEQSIPRNANGERFYVPKAADLEPTAVFWPACSNLVCVNNGRGSYALSVSQPGGMDPRRRNKMDISLNRRVPTSEFEGRKTEINNWHQDGRSCR